MKKIKLTSEELKYLSGALNFYCDETTHNRRDFFQLEVNSND